MIQIDAFTRHLVPCIIRDYSPADRAACEEVYASHVPATYSALVLEACLRLLDEGTSYLMVLEHEGRVVGCGGLELRGEGPFAHLVAGFIHKDCERRGFGATLLAARLALIEHGGEDIAVHLEAGTGVAAFYARFGFELAGVRANKLGPGQDSGQLLLTVQPAEVEALREALAAAGVVIELVSPEESGQDPVFDEI